MTTWTEPTPHWFAATRTPRGQDDDPHRLRTTGLTHDQRTTHRRWHLEQIRLEQTVLAEIITIRNPGPDELEQLTTIARRRIDHHQAVIAALETKSTTVVAPDDTATRRQRARALTTRNDTP